MPFAAAFQLRPRQNPCRQAHLPFPPRLQSLLLGIQEPTFWLAQPT
jgi:hypothetical protein